MLKFQSVTSGKNLKTKIEFCREPTFDAGYSFVINAIWHLWIVLFCILNTMCKKCLHFPFIYLVTKQNHWYNVKYIFVKYLGSMAPRKLVFAPALHHTPGLFAWSKKIIQGNMESSPYFKWNILLCRVR